MLLTTRAKIFSIIILVMFFLCSLSESMADNGDACEHYNSGGGKGGAPVFGVNTVAVVNVGEVARAGLKIVVNNERLESSGRTSERLYLVWVPRSNNHEYDGDYFYTDEYYAAAIKLKSELNGFIKKMRRDEVVLMSVIDVGWKQDGSDVEVYIGDVIDSAISGYVSLNIRVSDICKFDVAIRQN
ncbi:MAG: hypothetical protein ACK4E7_07625 [Permianibacter sp.]